MLVIEKQDADQLGVYPVHRAVVAGTQAVGWDLETGELLDPLALAGGEWGYLKCFQLPQETQPDAWPETLSVPSCGLA